MFNYAVGWRIWPRILLSWLTLNILPLAYLVWTIYRLGPNKTAHLGPVAPEAPMFSVPGVLSGVILAFAIFGFYRLWLAVVTTCPKRFYFDHVPAGLEKVEPSLSELKLDGALPSPCADYLFAAIYIGGASLAPSLLS